MNIGSVIRKYRKEVGLTQEAMADRLGVTTPAVNKWENGNSNPDIELLAPIARLLHISLDTLMSFHEELTLSEIDGIIRKMDKMFETEGFERAYEYALGRIKEYPNCNMLIWQIAVVLEARRLTGGCTEPEKYDAQINAWYEIALEDENEGIKHVAADSLFGFYFRKKEYAKAEKCLQYFSDHNPMKKILQGRLYQKQGKTAEAYEVFESCLFGEYQTLVSTFVAMIELALEEKDIEKAHFLAGKLGALSGIFETGKCKEYSLTLDAVHGEKNMEDIYQVVKQILPDDNSVCDFQKSRLFQHMRFSSPDSSIAGNGGINAEVLRQAAMVGAGSIWKGEDSHER